MTKLLITIIIAAGHYVTAWTDFSALCCTHQNGMFVCENSEATCQDLSTAIMCWDSTCRSKNRLLSTLIANAQARCCPNKPAFPNGKAGACSVPLEQSPLPVCSPDWVVVCESEWVGDWPGDFCVPQ